jgi:predicted metal-dependent peptidase
MTTTPDIQSQQQAAGKIGIAIRRLAEDYPFHAAILERFKVMHRADIDTMAVTVHGDKVGLLFNAPFVLSLPIDQLVGVVLHEVHHVLFEHILQDPEDYPDECARTMAEEVTVNEFVKEPLPEGVVTLEQFPSLKPMQSTDERYEQLKRRVRRPPISPPGNKAGPQQESGAGKQTGKQQAPAGGFQTVDDHRVWEEARQDPEGSKAAIEQVVREAVQEVGAENVPDYLEEAVGVLDSQWGNTPGSDETKLEGRRSGQLDWRTQLRRYVGQQLQPRPVFNRPSRRFPDLVGIIPGRRRQATQPRIMAVIDTSGSVTEELLELINAELSKLAKDYEVTVVECDTVIHEAYRYRPVTEVHGRGGTDFRPPFEREFLRRHRPDLVIYFTDGVGPAPESPPRVPVIWCLVPEGEAPCTWGRGIQMDTPGTEK